MYTPKLYNHIDTLTNIQPQVTETNHPQHFVTAVASFLESS